MKKLLSVVALVVALAMPMVAEAHPCTPVAVITATGTGPITAFALGTFAGFAAVYFIAENYQFPTTYLGLTNSYYSETDFPSGRS